MPESANAKNLYRCQACGEAIVTINRVEGTTPFTLGCRATEGCTGRMTSSFYRLPPDAPEPTWEWYRPGANKLRRLKRRDPATADHVERGGLLLRKIA